MSPPTTPTEGGTRRRRRRSRGSGADRVGSTFEADGQPGATDGSGEAASPERPAEGAGTHDGQGKEHHDGKPAPARRRRRRRPSTPAAGAGA